MICPATPVHAAPVPKASNGLTAIPWVQPAPAKRGFYGIVFASMPQSDGFALYTHGVSPNGGAAKVLWNVRKTAVARLLVLRGTAIASGDTFTQSFPRARGGGLPGAIYPSIVELPHAGCWKLELSTRGFRTSLVVLGVDAP